MEVYNKEFYINQMGGSYKSASKYMRYLLEDCTEYWGGGIKSVVDFGCGVGTWLKAAIDLNPALYVQGYDGDYVDRTLLMIDEDRFKPVDLSKEMEQEYKYDLAISVEVAEHISEKFADNFINSLCNASDTILFSAAICWQGGDEHINEQYLPYWIEKFEKHGYICDDTIRKNFWNDSEIDVWYRQNVVLFINKNSIQNKKFPLFNMDVLSVIHPELWDQKVREIDCHLLNKHYLYKKHKFIWKCLNQFKMI